MDYHARQADPQSGRMLNIDPHAENYYSLSPYSLLGNNPLMYIDPDGRDIEVSGTKTAKAGLQEIVKNGSGGFFKANISNKGKVTLEMTGKEGTMTDEQKAFYDVLTKIIKDKESIRISLVDHNDAESSGIAFGNYLSGKVDVGDVRALPSDNVYTQQGVLAHDIYEQYYKQKFQKGIDNKSDEAQANAFGEAHGLAIKNAQNPVNGTKRNTDNESKLPKKLGMNLNGNYHYSVTTKKGNSAIVTVTFKNGNVQKVRTLEGD